ncbi:MAG: TonB-dependent receptor, partial [Acidobacteria bacterium]|nr:TonB-dependent receptor [Acidobacteriota bacterium]
VNYTVDGVTSNSVNFGGRVGNMIEVSLDAVQEVNVLASNNSAEFPRAATMAVITRSGTNQLHGTAFYEHSNNIFNAAPFNHLKAKGPTRHEYGGSVGGPVYVPKVFDGRNRTFFFFNWEHTKPPGLSDWSASVPTLKMRSGDFSELLASGTIVKDYTTGAPFPNNVIPAPRFNSVSQKILTYNDYIPKPNYGPDNNFVQNYRILLPPGWWDDRYMVRGDQNIGNKDSLSGRLTLRKSPAVYPESAIQAFTREQYRGVANLYVSESHTFTPAIVNEFRFGYSRDYSHVKGNVLGAQVIKDWGIQGINLSNKQDLRGVPNVTFLNFASIYDSATYFWRGQTYEFLDNLSLTRGSHMIRTGFMLRKNLSDVTDKNTTADFGSYGFSRFATGFDFSDFLLGVPQATTRVERAPERNLRFAELGVYVNDDWRISKTLTLNLGLRYDYGVPPVERNDQRYAFNAATGQVVVPTAAALGRISPYYPKNIPIVTAAQAGYPERSLVKGDKNNFGPRIGFAWRPVPKTVIRGGYGFYYTNLVYTLIDRFSGGPFGGRETYDNVIENGQPRFQFPNPFLPAGRLPSQSMSGVVVNPQAANMQMWNLTVEREVGSGFVGRVSYRGFRTTQLGYEGNINKPMASADPNGGNWYRFNWFSSAYLFQTGAIQKMNALDVGVERRFQKGLVLQSGWTWAKDLTDAAGGLDGGVIEDPYNRRREMSNVPGVPRHRWVTSSVWEVPFGTGQRYGASAHPIIRQTVGNWSLSGITAFQTGNPLTPDFSGPDPSNTRQFGGRPDWVSDWKLSNPTVYQWYNPAAFAVPPNGRYGNAAPNIVFGPGLANFNFGVFKYFSLWEKGRLQFRMTATNFLNHPNYGDPNMSISSASAGRITGLRGNGDTSLGGGTRMIRMGLRLEF